MAQVNKFYTFVILCTGMAVGSTVTNKVMKPDMSIPKVQLPKKDE